MKVRMKMKKGGKGGIRYGFSAVVFSFFWFSHGWIESLIDRMIELSNSVLYGPVRLPTYRAMTQCGRHAMCD